MNEQEWVACEDSMRMLRSIGDKVSPRNEGLFAAACCRRLWDWLPGNCRDLVERMDRHAEDPQEPDVGGEEFEDRFHAAQAQAPGFARGAFDAVMLAACGYWRVPEDEGTEAEARGDAAWLAELRAQASLVRDIFGPLPFRPVVADPAWLAWKDGTIPRLAQAIYDERAFDRLPVLADALEESGCSNAEILAHLRGPGPHVRGCFAVDLLLGKS